MAMSSTDLDALALEYFREGRVEVAQSIMQQALPVPPESLIVAARCLQAMEAASPSFASSLVTRIAEYRRRVEHLGLRWWQADTLGDPNTPPEALFEVLGDEADVLVPTEFDSKVLVRARSGAPSRAAGAQQILRAIGIRIQPDVVNELSAACDEMAERGTRFQSQALFVDGHGQGYVLGLQLQPTTSGVKHVAEADQAMTQQAIVAIDRAMDGGGAKWDIEWPVSFEGTSIGLGVFVAGLVARHLLPPDAGLAATGHLEVTGAIRAVSGIAAKLNAAALSGIRRVLLPHANRAEGEAWLEQVQGAAPVALLYVANADEVRAKVLQASAGSQMGYEGWVRYVRHLIPQYGLAIDDEQRTTQYHRFKVADIGSACFITVYPNGRVFPTGPDGTALQAARRLVLEHIEASKPASRQTLTFNVPKERRQRLGDLVRNAGAEELQAKEHEAWRMKLTHGLSQATIILYNSGSCVLPSGTAPAFDELAALVRAALEGLGGEPRTPNSEGSARKTNTIPSDYDPEKPHIGTDEAGKGDFFGPLVSAAVFVDSSLGAQLKRLGVRDSKTMSDRTARRLASEIRRLVGKRAAITLIAPKRYNELYSQMRSEGKNLNTLLAWGHARSIEDLLLNGLRPAFIVVDQFADTRYMEQKILADTRQSGLPIVQFPKAEADIAVAAASVLARDGFLEWLEVHGRQLGRPLPKGASQTVVNTAREMVASHGPDSLREYAKTSFKTMQAVLAP